MFALCYSKQFLTTKCKFLSDVSGVNFSLQQECSYMSEWVIVV